MNDFVSVAVNQVEKDIKKMNIKDPVDRSPVSHTLNETPTTEPRQTNRDPCEWRYFLKKEGSFKYEHKPFKWQLYAQRENAMK